MSYTLTTAREVSPRFAITGGGVTPTCPLCTFYKSAHSELNTDVLAIPVFAVGRHGRAWDEVHPEDVEKGLGRTRWRVTNGCLHARSLKGEYQTEEEIQQAWAALVVELRETKDRR